MGQSDRNWKTLLEDAKRARELGKCTEAQELYRIAIAEAERTFGEGSEGLDLVLKSVLIELTDFFESKGLTEQAEPFYSQARQLMNKS